MIQPISNKDHVQNTPATPLVRPQSGGSKRQGVTPSTGAFNSSQPKDTSFFSQEATRRAQELAENKAEEVKESGAQKATEGPEAFSRSSSATGGK